MLPHRTCTPSRFSPNRGWETFTDAAIRIPPKKKSILYLFFGEPTPNVKGHSSTVADIWRRSHRRLPQPDIEIGSSVSPLRLPRILREQAFQQNKRVFAGTWRDGNNLVNINTTEYYSESGFSVPISSLAGYLHWHGW